MRASIFRSSYFIPMIVGLIFSLCFSVLAFIIINDFVEKNETAFKEHRNSMSRQIVESLKFPIWNLNSEYINNISKAFVFDNEKSVISIKILDERGKVLNETSRDIDDLQSVLSHEIIKEEHNVIYKERNIGKAIIEFSNFSRVEDVSKTLSSLLQWFGVTLFISIIIVSLFCYYFLIRPFNYFVKSLKSNADGDYSKVDEQFFLNEFSLLAKTLNYATSEIELRDEQLKKYNEELGEKVAKKSKELYIQKERSLVSERLASLGQMAAGIAHEINNPLFIILGNLSRLRREVGSENKKANEIIDKVDNGCSRISEIVKSMKTLSRTDSVNEKELIDAKELESIVMTICKGRVNENDITLSFQYEEGHQIYANKTQLYQVLVNLINNSIDAVSQLEDRGINVFFYDSPEKQCIEVVDSGHGIAPEIAERMMDPFFSTKDVNKGTGLGLSLSHEMMAKNGGDLIYDKSSKQTKFKLSLPRESKAI